MSSAIRIIIFSIVIFVLLRVDENSGNGEVVQWSLVGFTLFLLYLTHKIDPKKSQKDDDETYDKRDITEEYLSQLSCDICAGEINLDESSDGSEYVNIKHGFGYGSNYFGDNSTIDIDICEKCLYEIFQEKGLAHLIRNEYRESMQEWAEENKEETWGLDDIQYSSKEMISEKEMREYLRKRRKK